jgi:hypothetical protein
MKLAKATASDDEDLKTFLASQTIPGIYNYKLIRPHSFFDQYKLTTDDYQTYLLRDPDKKIHAMASILFKKAYINAQEQTIGYVTDLRVSGSRKATLSWGKEFVPMMASLQAERNCQYVFSELEQFESKAYNTLLRRRNRSINMPRYHLFRKFNLVVIYGRKFFVDAPLREIKIEHGRTEDVSEICRYLEEKSVRRPLRYHLTVEELERRSRDWPNFSLQNFLIARNFQGQIIGVMAPWNNRDVQRVVAQSYHGKSFQVYSTSRTLSLLKMTRPLPRPGEEFKLKHITHCAYDNPDIFYSLLNRAYDECKNQELLVYANYFGEYAGRPPHSFIHVKIPYGFYTLLDNEKTLPSYLHPNPFNPAPDFNVSHF